MTTVTISLPDAIARQIDRETSQKGFATRSEFIRTLLRRYFGSEEELRVFSQKPIEEIKLELAKTGKYDQKFIESITSGLLKSSLYAN